VSSRSEKNKSVQQQTSGCVRWKGGRGIEGNIVNRLPKEEMHFLATGIALLCQTSSTEVANKTMCSVEVSILPLVGAPKYSRNVRW
jgi:hypothetical protein